MTTKTHARCSLGAAYASPLAVGARYGGQDEPAQERVAAEGQRWVSRQVAALIRCVLAATAAIFAAAASAQPVALRDLRLQDQQGQVVTPASLRNRALLLNFIFTGCSTSCPLQVRELALLQRSLPADVRAGVQLLSVTVDPLNDTPKTMAAFARLHEADVPGWRFATGKPQQVDTLIARMAAIDPRKLPRKAEDHRTSLWLFDSSGAMVQRYSGVPLDRLRLAEEITRVVRQEKN